MTSLRRLDPLAHRFDRKTLAIAVGSLFLLGPLAATTGRAQESAPTDAGERATSKQAPVQTLESVTVTARKKTERLQDVPLAITAITGQTLQDTNSTNVRDIVNLTPGVSVTTGGGESNVNFTVRGISDLSGGLGDPDVAVFIDGVYQSNRGAISIGILDLLRVEVIKGPVSALYGRNAYSGVINYVTTPPQGPLEAAAAFTYGDYGKRAAKVSIGGALGYDNILGRLVVSHDEFNGTFRDAVNSHTAGGYRKDDLLGRITIKASERLTIDGSFYYGNDFFDNVPYAINGNNCGTVSASPLTPGQFTQFCGQFDPRQQPVQVSALNPQSNATGNQRRVNADSVRFNYDANIVDVSALFGYNKVDQLRFVTFSGTRVGSPYLATNGGVYNLETYFGQPTSDEDGSLDFRVSTKQDQPLRASVGTYLYHSRSTLDTLFSIDGTPLPPGVGVVTVAPAYNSALNRTGSPSANITDIKQTERLLSPFATLEYDVVPALTAAAEYRHTQQKRTFDEPSNLAFPGVDHPLGAAGTVDTKINFDNYRTSLRYKITPNQMVYASAANGTKGGGFNPGARVASELAFGPENNNTFEVGAKGSFLDGRAAVGVSAFRINARNVQITGPSSDPTNIALVTKNYARARSDGLDIDLSIAPIRGLVMTVGAGLATPKLLAGTYDFSGTDVANCRLYAPCASRVVTNAPTPQGPRAAVDLGGLQLPRSSKATISTAIQYNGQITQDLGYFVRADYRRESKQYEQTYQFSTIAPRNVVNLNASINTDRYRLTAYVKNLTNNATPEITAQNGFVSGGVGTYVGTLPEGRTYGLVAGVRY